MRLKKYNGLQFCLMLLAAATMLSASFSCGEMQREMILFQSSFEQDSLPGEVINGKREVFNGTGVLGRYEAGGFEIQLKDLPKHDMIRISFDLYIHDSWEGNAAAPNGRDIFIMNIDGWSSIYASFANKASCPTCPQSYPTVQPRYENNQFIFFDNPANANAVRTDLPGACELKDVRGGTVMYRIVKVFDHKGSTLKLGCFAQLEHPDPASKLCNESFSVDNMEIKAIEWR